MFKEKVKSNQVNGFTLIELSIVLVVIGLIVTTITAGGAMIESAKLRTVISDLKQIETAFWLYQDKYDALPGDHSTASDYRADAGNGNGSGHIAHQNFGLDGRGNAIESGYAFNHLSRADMVGGSYAGGSPVIGNVYMASPFDDAAYQFQHWSGFYGQRGNFIALGGWMTFYIGKSMLTTQQAKSIDKKMDDGSAQTGRLLGGNFDGSFDKVGGSRYTCAGSSDPRIYNIDKDGDEARCAVMYRLDSN